MNTGLVDTADPLWGHPAGDGAIAVTLAVTARTAVSQSVTIRECFWVSFMVMYTSSDTAMHAVTYQ